MSNKPENFVEYFKIKWSRMSTWSLEEAAALSCGKNPELKEYEIGLKQTNPVSKRYYWLCNQEEKGNLGRTHIDADGSIRKNTGSLLRSLESKFTCDKDMRKALNHMYQSPFGLDHTKFVSRSVYREAGRLIFEKYPTARKPDVAKILADLPKFYNNSTWGHIEALKAHQIEPYLKNLSALKQKPSKENIPDIAIDLKQLVENM